MGKCERSRARQRKRDTSRSAGQRNQLTESTEKQDCQETCRTCRPINRKISVRLQLIALTSPPSTVVYCRSANIDIRETMQGKQRTLVDHHPLTLICCTREALSPNDRLARHALSRVQRWERRASLSSAVSEARRCLRRARSFSSRCSRASTLSEARRFLSLSRRLANLISLSVASSLTMVDTGCVAMLMMLKLVVQY